MSKNNLIDEKEINQKILENIEDNDNLIQEKNVKRKNKKDFSKGKIYEINNDIDDKVYIGSTTLTLNRRFAEHKYNINKEKYITILLYQLMREYGIEHFKIKLLENYPCKNNTELTNRENYYIDNSNFVLNMKRALMNRIKEYLSEQAKKNYYKNINTKKNYYKKNKEELIKKSKENYDRKKLEIKEKNKIMFKCVFEEFE